jgi:hypothetical protein
MKRRIFALGLALLILAAFLTSVNNLEQDRRKEGRQQLEEAVRNAAVACYAAEGAYPPDVAYLQQHYGLQYSQEDYILYYTLEASNLMPEITVLEK